MFMHTPRLLLRPGWPEDSHALSMAIANEAIVLNLAKVPWPYDINEAESYLGRDPAKSEVDLLIFVRTHGAPRLIGGIGLAREGADIELGYWVVPSCWGLGFATEAGHAVVAMARETLRLDRIVAAHFLDNPASANVLAKLGFKSTGERFERESRGRGMNVACARYALPLKAMALAA